MMDKSKIINGVCNQLAIELCKTESLPLFLIGQNSKGDTSLLTSNNDLTEDHIIQFLKAFVYQLEINKSAILKPGTGQIITLRRE